MWKIIILAVSVAAGANIEQFTGKWSAVALYPPVIFLPVCLEQSFVVNPDNLTCTCADGKKTELLVASTIIDGKVVEEGKTVYPTMVVEDVSEVANSVNVSCTCGEKVHPNRVVIKSVNSNYFIMFKPQDIIKTEPNSATLYAREVITYMGLVNVMMNITDLSGRAGGVLCSTEVLNNNLLSKFKLEQNEQL